MSKQLNIKDAATVELARNLAKKLDLSVTAVVREALEAKAQLAQADDMAKAAEIDGIVERFQRAMPPEWRHKTSKEIMDELYDENGLPT